MIEARRRRLRRRVLRVPRPNNNNIIIQHHHILMNNNNVNEPTTETAVVIEEENNDNVEAPPAPLHEEEHQPALTPAEIHDSFAFFGRIINQRDAHWRSEIARLEGLIVRLTEENAGLRDRVGYIEDRIIY